MFANKYKPLKIIIPLLIILIMVLYGTNKIPQKYPGYEEARNNPGKYIEKEIYTGGKISVIKEHYFQFVANGITVKANGDLDKYGVGANISGRAVFHEDKSVTFTSYHISSLRDYKIWLSLLPTLFIAYLFFRQYKFNFKKMMFE